MDEGSVLQKVLVTGGAGFIGSHTVDALLARGCQVKVLDNLSSGKLSNLPESHPGLEFVQGDIRDADLVDRICENVDAVLHLAAQVSVQSSIEQPVLSSEINVRGFLNVLDAARRQGIKRLVYASSAAVYGMPSELPLSESAKTRPMSPYGLEKLINDQYAALYAELYGMACMGMRYFNVFGPRQDPRSPYAGVISKFNDCARAGSALKVFGDGLQTRDFVYVGDIAASNVAALYSDLPGTCNIGTGRSVTLLQMIDALGEVVGRTLPVEHYPERSGDIRDSCAVVERMQRALGVTAQVSLVDGLRRLWLQAG